MFISFELKFRAFELIFKASEHRFKAYERSFLLGLETIINRNNINNYKERKQYGKVQVLLLSLPCLSLDFLVFFLQH